MNLHPQNLLATLLESSVSTHCSILGRIVHAYIIRTHQTPFPSFLSNHLVKMYSKLDLINSAQHVLSLTHLPTVVTWTSLISGCIHNRRFMAAITHFTNMRRYSVHPNDFTYPCVFKASASLQMPITGKQLHSLALKDVRCGYKEDVSVANGLIDFYGKCGDIVSSEMVFSRIGMRRNVVSWCSMLAAFVQNHEEERACMVFLQAMREVEPTDFMISSVLSACAELGGLELGRSIHALALLTQ
ncbi:hypothetical protein TSUD_46370 [Trifolium subterraneum]|uniref:Pentatricopeptide repeat-containing protein n=1 Tax=Trifolium subterraneum TaxID=3900 RepID=A0A2Z6PDS7_TRISU|nr:hypothetical protein TSUD_46370 [Trifolium subterraneum]